MVSTFGMFHIPTKSLRIRSLKDIFFPFRLPVLLIKGDRKRRFMTAHQKKALPSASLIRRERLFFLLCQNIFVFTDDAADDTDRG